MVVEFADLKPYFDAMPIAFAVAELVPGGAGEADGLVLRYANPALERLEKGEPAWPLGKRLDRAAARRSAGREWLACACAACRGETRELRAFHPETGRYIRAVCYPWPRPGCCGCVLLDETALVRTEMRIARLARWDGITGFGSRNAYGEFLERFLGGKDTGVIFVDVNGLKATNDRFGHEAGDFLLRLVRDRICGVFPRMNRRIFRIGGDEFVLILRPAARDSVRRRAALLRERMRNPDLPWLPSSLAAVGWSWTARADSLRDLVRQADQAMYEEKRRYYAAPERESSPPALP